MIAPPVRKRGKRKKGDLLSDARRHRRSSSGCHAVPHRPTRSVELGVEADITDKEKEEKGKGKGKKKQDQRSGSVRTFASRAARRREAFKGERKRRERGKKKPRWPNVDFLPDPENTLGIKGEGKKKNDVPDVGAFGLVA